MATYAALTNNVVTGIIDLEPGDAAVVGGLVQIDGVSPKPSVGWTYTNNTWEAPDPTALSPGVEQAAAILGSLLQQESQLTSQIQADAALWQNTAVGSSLTADHLAALQRMVNGFTTVLQCVSSLAILSGYIQPQNSVATHLSP